jgi:hypothetical protein
VEIDMFQILYKMPPFFPGMLGMVYVIRKIERMNLCSNPEIAGCFVIDPGRFSKPGTPLENMRRLNSAYRRYHKMELIDRERINSYDRNKAFNYKL